MFFFGNNGVKFTAARVQGDLSSYIIINNVFLYILKRSYFHRQLQLIQSNSTVEKKKKRNEIHNRTSYPQGSCPNRYNHYRSELVCFIADDNAELTSKWTQILSPELQMRKSFQLSNKPILRCCFWCRFSWGLVSWWTERIFCSALCQLYTTLVIKEKKKFNKIAAAFTNERM